MKIDRALVRKIAQLAHLEFPRTQSPDGKWVDSPDCLLSDAELDRLANELGAILDYVADLDGLDLFAVPPTSHPVPLPERMREDLPEATIDREQVLAGAPRRTENSFVVPRVIE